MLLCFMNKVFSFSLSKHNWQLQQEILVTINTISSSLHHVAQKESRSCKNLYLRLISNHKHTALTYEYSVFFFSFETRHLQFFHNLSKGFRIYSLIDIEYFIVCRVFSMGQVTVQSAIRYIGKTQNAKKRPQGVDIIITCVCKQVTRCAS